LQLDHAAGQSRRREPQERAAGLRSLVVEVEWREILLVKNIEEIRTQFQVRRLFEPRQAGVLREAQVCLEEARSTERISADSRRTDSGQIEVRSAPVGEIAAGFERADGLAVSRAPKVLGRADGPKRWTAGCLYRLANYRGPRKTGVPLQSWR